MRYPFFFAACVLGLLSSEMASAQEAVHLKWNLSPGHTFSLQMTTETDQSMTVQNMPVKQKQTQTFLFSFTAKAEQAGKGWVVVQKIEDVKLDIDIGGNKINTQGGNDQLNKFVAAMKGSEFEIVLDKKYKIVEVRGADRLIKQLSDANPGMEPLLKQLLNENSIKQMGHFFEWIPPMPVKKGDRWAEESTMNLGPIGSYQMVNRFLYEGLEGPYHKIKNEPTTTYIAPKPGAGGGLAFTIKNGNLTTKEAHGNILFNNKLGILHRAETKMAMAGKLSIEIGGQVTDVEMEQTQKIIIEHKTK